MKKPNAKQNRFQIVTIFFLLFSSAYFLDIMSPMFPQVLANTFGTDPWLSWADPERGTGGPDPSEKLQKFRVSKQHLSRSPEKPHSYKASIQCLANIGPPAKRHLNGVSLAGRLWPAYSGILILPPLIS